MPPAVLMQLPEAVDPGYLKARPGLRMPTCQQVQLDHYITQIAVRITNRVGIFGSQEEPGIACCRCKQEQQKPFSRRRRSVRQPPVPREKQKRYRYDCMGKHIPVHATGCLFPTASR